MVTEVRLASVRNGVTNINALTRIHLKASCVAALLWITVVHGQGDLEIRADDLGGAAQGAAAQTNDTADLKLELLTAAADWYWIFVSLHKAGRDIRPVRAASAKSIAGIAPMSVRAEDERRREWVG
jgi:hypothetical protein